MTMSSASGDASVPPADSGWDADEAFRAVGRRDIFLARAWQERVRDGVMDPDGTGCVNFEERFFADLQTAERWLRWQLAQWPPRLADRTDDELLTGGFIDGVRFDRLDELAQPQWEYSGVEQRYYDGCA
jgi:hypothetical protein